MSHQELAPFTADDFAMVPSVVGDFSDRAGSEMLDHAGTGQVVNACFERRWFHPDLFPGFNFFGTPDTLHVKAGAMADFVSGQDDEIITLDHLHFLAQSEDFGVTAVHHDNQLLLYGFIIANQPDKINAGLF